jgi:hypothetical protein
VPVEQRPFPAPKRSPGHLVAAIFVLAAALGGEVLAGEAFVRDPEQRSLADLLKADDGPGKWIPGVPRARVDEARAAAEGIRKVEGRRLILFTDVPPDGEVDELPAVFEQAFAGWCSYFDIDPAVQVNWHMTGFLMKDGDRFRRAGLLPAMLPSFPNGFAVNYDLWIYEQPTAYYRRHLLLHEGTHGFMNTILKSCGPPWYMEGMAELLGTHRWEGGRLALGTVPKTRDEAPMWGRVRTIQDLFAAGNALPLEQVLDFDGRAHSQNEAYAWSWAVAAFLDFHPRYRQAFRSLSRAVEAEDFLDKFRELVGGQWGELAEEWQVFISNLEYGYDAERMAIDFSAGQPPAEGWNLVKIDAALGWQNTRLHLPAGSVCEIRARGRYQLAERPRTWWCEPGGVTIRYYQGKPLGMLLAAVRPGAPAQGPSALIRPLAIGLGSAFTVEKAGTLYLRVNDSAGELDDNAGSLDAAVRLSPAPAAPAQ